MDVLEQTWTYATDNRETVLDQLTQHLWLALVPVVVATLLALPLGWLAVTGLGPGRWLRQLLLTASSILYTVPSLALFLLLPGILGTSILDPLNVAVALTVYSLALLVRSVVDALESVDPLVVQAATAVGYAPVRRWFAVDLPLALPVLFAGVRVATVSNVSMVSVAALIGTENLGQLFTRGIQLNFYAAPIVLGLVLTVALAVLADLLVVLVQRVATPWSRKAVGG